MTNAILGTDRNSLTASSVATTVSGRQRSRSSTTTTRSMSDSCFISSAKSSWKPCRVGSAAVSSSPPKSSMTSSIFGRPIERPRPPADGDQRHRRTAPLVSNDAPRRHRGDVKASQNRQRWREFRHVWGDFGLRVMKFATPDAASKCENLSVCWRSRSGANRTRTGDLVGAIQGAQCQGRSKSRPLPPVEKWAIGVGCAGRKVTPLLPPRPLRRRRPEGEPEQRARALSRSPWCARDAPVRGP
jgi:hypothetical protein